MHLPALSHWQNTRIGLHQAAQVLGAVQTAFAEPEPNYLHLALRVSPHGLTTRALPMDDWLFDFGDQSLHNQDRHIPLAHHSQITLTDEIEKFTSAASMRCGC